MTSIKYIIPWPPHKDKIYFPFTSYTRLKNNPIYQPFSSSGKSIWKLWAFLLKYFVRKDFNSFIQSNNLGEVINKDSQVIIFKGEKDKDPNYTILSVDDELKSEKVTKIAFKGYGRELTENEIYVLKRIKDLPYTPELLSFAKEESFAYFTTKAFQGENLSSNELTDDILELMFKINQIDIKKVKHYGNKDLIQRFAHGDFCPWNMIKNESIFVYDWEMSGIYPLGYDLFMFIFQYELLVLNNDDYCIQILQVNQAKIEAYFEHYDVENYMPYFHEFVKIRIDTIQNDDLKKSFVKYLIEIS